MTFGPCRAARHLQLAGDEVDAALAYARASDQARSVSAHADAIGHLRAALAMGHSEPSALNAAIGDPQTLLGDYAGAVHSEETAASTFTADRLSGIGRETAIARPPCTTMSPTSSTRMARPTRRCSISSWR